MDTQAYIASGILEQYAFGLLTPAERGEVEANVQRYPELAEELRQIEYAIEQYLSLYQAPVSPEVKQRIDRKIQDVTPEPLLRPARAAAGGGRSRINSWLLGLLLLNLAATAWLFYENREQNAAYAELQAEYETLRQNCADTETRNRGLLIELETIRQTGNRLIQMRGTDNAPAAIASVLYNPETENAYLDVIDLPTPPTDKQYQLWAIVADVPVSMGVFDLPADGVNGLLEVPYVENAAAFAVTLEPRGGSVTPTLEDMVTLGTVSG